MIVEPTEDSAVFYLLLAQPFGVLANVHPHPGLFAPRAARGHEAGSTENLLRLEELPDEIPDCLRGAFQPLLLNCVKTNVCAHVAPPTFGFTFNYPTE